MHISIKDTPEDRHTVALLPLLDDALEQHSADEAERGAEVRVWCEVVGQHELHGMSAA
jgi:hypothetical protein